MKNKFFLLIICIIYILSFSIVRSEEKSIEQNSTRLQITSITQKGEKISIVFNHKLRIIGFKMINRNVKFPACSTKANNDLPLLTPKSSEGEKFLFRMQDYILNNKTYTTVDSSLKVTDVEFVNNFACVTFNNTVGVRGFYVDKNGKIEWPIDKKQQSKRQIVIPITEKLKQKVENAIRDRALSLGLPFGNYADYRLAFIDVETTGLKPGFNEMVDIGIIIAELDGEEMARFHTRIMPKHTNRISEKAREITGFTKDRWEKFDALSNKDAVDKITDFFKKNTKGNRVILCAHNATFDVAFFDHLFRSAGKNFRETHNSVLDLPSMAWGMGLRQLHGWKLRKYLGIENEPKATPENPCIHTGINGAEKNLSVYRKLIRTDVNYHRILSNK